MTIKNPINKPLSVFGLVMINVIAIDSLRNIPTNAAVGLSIVSYYLLAGIFFLLPCILITAELATHYPKRGGVYVWVREAFGPCAAFIVIWLQWIYNVIWYPSILLFIATNIAYLIDPQLVHLKAYMITMVITMFLIASAVNAYGIKISSIVSTISALVGTLIPMLILIGLAIIWVYEGKPLALHPSSWQAFLPHFNHFHQLAFFSIVMFSFMGIEMSAVHAGEVQNPERKFPRALCISGSLIILSLILATLAIALIVPPHSLSIISGMDQALTLFLNQNHLHWLLPIIIIMVIIGSFGGMSAWVVGPAKALMVAAEDGALPHILQKTNRFHAPIGILILQCLLVIILCSLFFIYQHMSTAYWILSNMAAILALVFYILFFAAAIQLRYQTEAAPHRFRIPGANHSGIWLAGTIGISACVLVIIISFIPPANIPITNITVYESLLSVGSLLLACIPLPIYWWMQRQRK